MRKQLRYSQQAALAQAHGSSAVSPERS